MPTVIKNSGGLYFTFKLWVYSLKHFSFSFVYEGNLVPYKSKIEFGWLVGIFECFADILVKQT